MDLPDTSVSVHMVNAMVPLADVVDRVLDE